MDKRMRMMDRGITGAAFVKWVALFLLSAFFITAMPAEAQQYRPVRIMALGDSLTSSIDGQASYRYWLWRGLTRRGFWINFVGTQTGVGSGSSPGGFDPHHEGHPGATTQDILENVRGWALQTRPDVVLLLVGANDLDQGSTPTDALKNSVRIIAQLRSVNPNVKILWAMLPPAYDQMETAKDYDRGVLRLAPLVSTPYSPVRIVNLYSGFNPEADTVDGIHPNATGERKFAYRFMVSLIPVLWQFRVM